MGRYFQYDFGGIRIHHDKAANESAASIGAHAYTVGRDIVFGRGGYQPRRSRGLGLLAHELAHVVQQQGSVPRALKVSDGGSALEHEANEAAAGITSAPWSIARIPFSTAGGVGLQREPITGKRDTVPDYQVEVGDDDALRQVETGKQVGSAVLTLSYDPKAGTLAVTFPLVWIFVHEWSDAQRDDYVKEFEQVVLKAWNDRFPLIESGKKVRTAHVKINFDEKIVHKKDSASDEARELSKSESGRWTMDVRDLHVRAKVKHGLTTVELGEGSNKPQSLKAKELRERASAVLSDAGGNKTFTQTASAHEFGHMIGLGDEYVKDVGEEMPIPAQMYINSRIMNVGADVTRDAYAPFAQWLSKLTSSTWRVGSR
jgi:Domain of unknown function (DUF4157)